MVEVKIIQSLYFSPTGNARKIVEAIAKGTGYTAEKSIDLTLPKQREAWHGKIESNLLIVGVPIYASSFPSLILPSLKKIDGVGRWAVPVAVSGNVQMRTCLADLAGILKNQGFMIPAAANFVGEHSMTSEKFPMGVGRPDGRDIRKAKSFGKKIVAKMLDNPEDITSSRGENIWLRTYLTGALEAKGTSFQGRYSKDIFVSEEDKERCNNCHKCVESCPTGAIDPINLQVNEVACIRCFACTTVCPSGAKKKVVNADPGLEAWFKKQGSLRAEPQIIF